MSSETSPAAGPGSDAENSDLAALTPVDPAARTAPPVLGALHLPPGGILIGLGADVIEVDRIRGVLERQGDRFIKRVFTEEERAYCFGMKHPHKHLAARFAAKEAVSKCFTTGIGAELGWRSVSVYHGPRHQPLVRLDEKGQVLLAAVGATHVHLTLSHTETVAMAVAALVRQPG